MNHNKLIQKYNIYTTLFITIAIINLFVNTLGWFSTLFNLPLFTDIFVKNGTVYWTDTTLFLIFIETVLYVSLLIWVYKTHNVLSHYMTRPLKSSVGKSLLYFIIPIVNFVMPYFVLKEFYEESLSLLKKYNERKDWLIPVVTLSWAFLLFTKPILFKTVHRMSLEFDIYSSVMVSGITALAKIFFTALIVYTVMIIRGSLQILYNNKE